MTPSSVLAVRAAWGAALLAAPGPVLRVLAHPRHRHRRSAQAVLRVLGARHLLQAAAGLAGPRPTVLYASAGVDGLHALTGVALAVLDPRWRRGALVDAAVASAFAAATALTARPRRS